MTWTAVWFLAAFLAVAAGVGMVVADSRRRRRWRDAYLVELPEEPGGPVDLFEPPPKNPS